MFAMSAQKRERRDFIKAVRKLYKDTFSLDDKGFRKHNQVWEDWLQVKEKEPGNLIGLLNQVGINDAFKARALTILLLPKLSIKPFQWGEKYSAPDNNYTMMLSGFDFSVLSPELQRYMFEYLALCMQLAMDADLESETKVRETLYHYNRIVIFALGVLDKDEPSALKLFSLWQPLSPTVYCNMDTASGYDEIFVMLHAKIPNIWKWKTHERMKKIILSEISGKTKPRADWEGARLGYHSAINRGFHSKKFPYDTYLFADQVEFLIGPGNETGKEGFRDYYCKNIYHLLEGDEYLELRRRFARYMILGDHGEYFSFKIYGEEEMQVARQMLSEANENDQELKTELQRLIVEGREWIKNAQAKDDKVTSQVEGVMLQMKV
jgi:hypothetical protein